MSIFYIHYKCLKDGKTVQETEDKTNLFASRKEAKDLADESVACFNAGCKIGVWSYTIKRL